MRYREIKPCRALRAYLRCFWELEGSATDPVSHETILPDGCPEIVFHIGDPFVQDGRIQPRAMFVGQMPGPTLVQPAGAVQCFGVRFEPAGAEVLFHFRQADVFGSIVPQSGLLGSAIERQILSANTMTERIQLIEAALSRLTPDGEDPWCAAVSAVLARRLSIEDLRDNSGVGIRQFERIFLTRVGMTPRLFVRLARFLQALRQSGDWACVAAACGYYDQSHLIRDFRQFAGASPSTIRPGLMSQSSNTDMQAPV